MKLSVIIPTYNEGENILDCIKSLEGQSYKDIEIIVVDDGSTDNTLSMISSFKFQNSTSGSNQLLVGNIQLLKQDHKGPGAARNKGAKHANGEILVFVDADMTFDENFLKELVYPILNGKVKGTFSKNEIVSNWENIWVRCWNINQGWEKKRRHPKNYPDKQKVFRAILKSEFEMVGGFTPGGYTDDYSLAEKLGYEAEAVNGAIFYHKNPDNLKEVYLQAKWAAKRKYKLGKIGFIVTLLRTSFALSFINGILRSTVNFEPAFVIFKLVYDAGSFWGVIDFLLKGRESK